MKDLCCFSSVKKDEVGLGQCAGPRIILLEKQPLLVMLLLKSITS